MLPEVVQILTFILIIGALLFAGVAGGWPERTVAGILIGGTALTWTTQALAGPSPEGAFLLIDVMVGLGLLAVLIRTKLFWAGVACCAQMLMLAFTATRFFNFPLSELGYLKMLQVSSILVSLSLIYGTWSRRWGPQPEPEYA